MPEPEEAQAYMSFLAAICAMAKEAKRDAAKAERLAAAVNEAASEEPEEVPSDD